MQLLIDIGNTRLKWAFATSEATLGAWFASSAMDTVAAENLAEALAAVLNGAVFRTACSVVLISNVAGPQAAALVKTQILRLDPDLSAAIHWFASAPLLGGVENRYREPEKLGCDRFAALIGARALHPGQPLCVVNCGTATTIDALSASGEFLGGWILPGLNLMKGALVANTALLPDRRTANYDNKFPEKSYTDRSYQADDRSSRETDRLFGDNTESGIDLGCLAAQAGAINRAISLHDKAHCILSGGSAKPVSAGLSSSFTLVENLVLIGLQIIARNTDSQAGVPTQTP